MSLCRILTVGVAAIVLSAQANAGQRLEVQVDKSRMLMLPGTPGAIVIGNPSVADVTTNGNQIFVHGRNFGETNLMVLDLDGKPIMDFDVVTRNVNDSAMALYSSTTASGASRTSFSCAPLCEADMQVGDEVTTFANVLASASAKTKFATGSETSEAKAPQAPQ
jgi:Flp pilus assembly secretin CpaC